MAYNLQHTAQFYDIGSHLWTIELKGLDYAGSATAITRMGGSPLMFDFGKTSPLPHAEPIRDTRATMMFESPARLFYSYLYSTNQKQTRVEIKHKSSVFFVGYLVGDSYVEPYRPAPFMVQFMAADGLLLLKNRVWDVSGRLTGFEIIKRCLDETGLGLNFLISASTMAMYLSGFFPTIEGDPLYNLVIGLDTYIENENSYYDVLKELLTAYGLIIKQVAGKWEIVQFNNKASGSYFYKTFNSGGVQIDSGTANPTINTNTNDTTNALSILNSSSLKINPGFKNVMITQNLAAIDSLVKNGEFDDFTVINASSGIFAEWNTSGQTNQYPNEGGFYALMRGYKTAATPTMTTPYLTQQLGNIEQGAALQLSIDWGVMGSEAQDLFADVYIMLKIGSYYGLYRDFGDYVDGGFTFQENFIKVGRVKAQSNVNTKFNRFELYFPEVLGGGTVQLYLFCPVNADYYSGAAIAGSVWDKVSLRAVTSEGEIVQTKIETIKEINSNSNYEPSKITLNMGDAPPIVSAINTYTNIFTTASGAAISSWIYSSFSGTLLEILAEQIAFMFSNPKLLLQANIVSDVLNVNSLITDSNRLGTRIFEINRARLDAKRLLWSGVEMLEINGEALPDFDNSDFDNSDFDT